MRAGVLIVGFGFVLALVAASHPSAQLPFATPKSSGQTVTPAYEGWYKNPDGSYNLSFGYYNRNAEEVVDIPIGPDNLIEPGDANQGQPTEFQPRRHWGVFAVKVPASFAGQTLTWTLKFRGASYAIPATLNPNWQIDALEGEAGAGNTPPSLSFNQGGPEGSGPYGITSGPMTASVGKPLAVMVWARDDGRASGGISTAGREAQPVTLTWFKHQGPGKVTFDPATARVNASGGQSSTNALFSVPGDYLLRVRANDASGVAGAGHAQCCWSNGFVKVAVR